MTPLWLAVRNVFSPYSFNYSFSCQRGTKMLLIKLFFIWSLSTTYLQTTRLLFHIFERNLDRDFPRHVRWTTLCFFWFCLYQIHIKWQCGMGQDWCGVGRHGSTDISLVNYCVVSPEGRFSGRIVEVQFFSWETVEVVFLDKQTSRGGQLPKNTKSIVQTQERYFKEADCDGLFQCKPETWWC